MVDINLDVTKDEINAGIKKANALNGTASEINTILSNVSKKQDSLVSGTNIKTINNQSILGSGNINIESGSSGIDLKDIKPYLDGQWVSSTEITLASNTSFPISSVVNYDLSSFIPNDGYNYEVLVRGLINTSKYLHILIKSSLIPYTSLIALQVNGYMGAAAASTLIPVGTDRTLTMSARPNDVGSFYLFLLSWRRLGKALPQ